jgi:hypothetical protein
MSLDVLRNETQQRKHLSSALTLRRERMPCKLPGKPRLMSLIADRSMNSLSKELATHTVLEEAVVDPMARDRCTRLLREGTLPVHGAAVCWRGHGLLLSGLPGSGKTGIVLAAMTESRALFAGEECVWLQANGMMVRAHLDLEVRARYLTGTWKTNLPILPRLTCWGLQAAANISRPLAPRLADRFSGRRLRLPPDRLFGPDRCRDQLGLDALILLQPGGTDDPIIEACSERDAVMGLAEVCRREFAALGNVFDYDPEENLEAKLQAALAGKSSFQVSYKPEATPDEVWQTVITAIES